MFLLIVFIVVVCVCLYLASDDNHRAQTHFGKIPNIKLFSFVLLVLFVCLFVFFYLDRIDHKNGQSNLSF